MTNPASISKARQKAKKRKAAEGDRAQLERETTRRVTQFQLDNGTHEWSSGIQNGEDVVRCVDCGEVVTAVAMMSDRVRLPDCAAGAA